MSTYSASHHTIPFSANPLCFVYSTQCFSIFQFFSSMYTGASIKTCQVDNQVQGQTPGTISKFFFLMFSLWPGQRPSLSLYWKVRPSRKPRGNGLLLLIFLFCLSWQVGPTVAQQQPVVDAQQQPPAPAVAKNTQAIRHCYIVFIGHT